MPLNFFKYLLNQLLLWMILLRDPFCFHLFNSPYKRNGLCVWISIFYRCCLIWSLCWCWMADMTEENYTPFLFLRLESWGMFSNWGPLVLTLCSFYYIVWGAVCEITETSQFEITEILFKKSWDMITFILRMQLT